MKMIELSMGLSVIDRRDISVLHLCEVTTIIHYYTKMRYPSFSDLIMSLLQIFGPILPIRAVDSINEAIEYVNKRDRPLALYLFTNDSGIVEDVLNKTTSGGVCINDTVMHYTGNEYFHV